MTEHEAELRARRLKGIPRPREAHVSTTQDLGALLEAREDPELIHQDDTSRRDDGQARELYEDARARLESAPGHDLGECRPWDALADWERRVWIDAVRDSQPES